MSINPEIITQVQTLLQADPAMLVQLQAQTELAGVAAVVAKAAAAQGLDVSESNVMSHLASEQSQVTAAAMSDPELEQVAGGFSVDDWSGALALWRQKSAELDPMREALTREMARIISASQ